ncbi:MAG: ribosome-binding factor A [Myxococcota bacterium]
MLIGLYVVSVTPMPAPGRLRVWVASHDPDTDPSVALSHLIAARGWLREEVAEAINRSRVPELVFEWSVPEVTS